MIPLLLVFSLLGDIRQLDLLLERSRLGFDGFGPIRIGMTEKEVARVAGSLDIEPADAPEACHHAWPRHRHGVAFMIEDGRVTRIELSVDRYRTVSGLRIGQSEAHALRLYSGRVEVTRHKYDPEGHYLTVRSRDRRRAMVIETDGKRVTEIRAGLVPSVEYVEGCL